MNFAPNVTATSAPSSGTDRHEPGTCTLTCHGYSHDGRPVLSRAVDGERLIRSNTPPYIPVPAPAHRGRPRLYPKRAARRMVREFAQIDNRSIEHDVPADRMSARPRRVEMDARHPPSRPRRLRRLRGGDVALFAVFLLSGPAFAACSDAHWHVDRDVGVGDADDARHRHADVRRQAVAGPLAPTTCGSNARTEEAYAFALPSDRSSPGCRATAAARRWATAATSTATSSTGAGATGPLFEEHASFCDICVQITLKTKQLAASKASPCTRSDRSSTRPTVGPGRPAPTPPSRRSDRIRR